MKCCSAWLLAMAVATAASPAAADRFKPVDDATPQVRYKVPTAPFSGLARWLISPFRADPVLENSSPLIRETGWTSLTFDIEEPASALFLAVQGKAQFETADIQLANGAVVSVNLHHSERGGGLFELHTLDSEQRVSRVRLTARATTNQARVGLRIGR